MKKVIIQISLAVILFFALWFSLAQVNWVKIFDVEKNIDKTEQKLGNLFWKFFKNSEKENTNIQTTKIIDSIVNHLCNANKIDRKKIKVHILLKDEINAFALPNGHLIIYSGLVLNADSQEELAGVICHEIAHIELKHVMRKLIRETGISLLISITTGNGNLEVIKETAKLLSSAAFSRELEKEADMKAVDYLLNAKVNPAPFADFLYKLSEINPTIPEYLTWVSSHPESKERAKYVVEYSKQKDADYKTIISTKTWEELKNNLKE